MMIVVANLRLSGFFRLVDAWVVRRAHRADRCCLPAVTPGLRRVLRLPRERRDLPGSDAAGAGLTVGVAARPVPYLLAVAMASNVGSTATITGNPQNIMIGSFSRHPLRAFRRRAGAGGAMGWAP